MPPPLPPAAPLLVPLPQTVSLLQLLFPLTLRVVPPTATTLGEAAGHCGVTVVPDS